MSISVAMALFTGASAVVVGVTVVYGAHAVARSAAENAHSTSQSEQKAQPGRYDGESWHMEGTADLSYHRALQNAEFWTWAATWCSFAPVRPVKPVIPIGGPGAPRRDLRD